MGNPLSTAFTLLAIGMITVFAVLFLVYVAGTGLIILINRISPNSKGKDNNRDVSLPVIAAITSAVDAITSGKGRVSKIEKEL